MKQNIFFISALAALALVSPARAAVEPWADSSLPVQSGLELWLDASHENDARKSEGDTGHKRRSNPLANNSAVDFWHDASGNRRHVQQEVSGFRPKLVYAASGYAIRFDGKDDFLFGVGGEKKFRFGTIFIRANIKSNPGGLSGFLAFNKPGENDYNTGFNIDLGPDKSKTFNFLNLEGNGFVGISNVIGRPLPFGIPHTVTISISDAESGIHVWVDNLFQGTRKRQEAELTLDELTVGARHFSNSGEPPFVQNFFDGDIMEVLVYSRVFGPDETEKTEKYLAGKYKAPDETDRKFVPLVAVSNVPPVQVLLPGYTVRELPLTLNNINCLKYREDGKLVALGYDGNIFLLSDTDGDGIEDKVTPFWNTNSLRAPIGMALTPPGYSRGPGMFVASKSKVSLIVDTNHDDVADEEIIVAQGWHELPHGVDALGVAIDKDGSVFFGLGCQNFAGAYLIDPANGKSTYSLQSERGTILKVSPDFTKREIYCTGIRFPVAMAFNAEGDLFCSDQEGATWLPNGNPFDELLHILPNRHYGFPPRHPTHLPGVIDEPSVFDYAPQHQSTCGLNFNLAANGKFFGPDWWKGDAIMTGYSRGKLWRTKLAKTAEGYVAQSQLFACLNMLTVDACASPQGDLVVAVHSGQPDWGSGPTGAGKLYKISYTDKTAPQPVLTWAASPTETRVEFDRPLDATQFKDFAKQVKVTQGRYVAAGDQFEYWRPGYQVVQNQLAEPRYELNIFSVALEDAGRTLTIRTAPRKVAANYAITLPRKEVKPATTNELPQYATIDVSHNLCGVGATWSDAAKTKNAADWLPHLNLAVSRAFTDGSEDHAQFWHSIQAPGELKLTTQLDLHQMLRAATQPGAKLDFEYPDETVTLIFKGNTPLQIVAGAGKVERVSDSETRLTVEAPKKDKWVALEATLKTAGDKEPRFEISWFTAEDPRLRAFPLRRFFLPWAMPQEDVSPKNEERIVPEIAGGNWLRGKRIFFGDQAACYKCHTVGRDGGHIGPDLSNLIHRDYASVLKDITQPSAAINPDHVAYNIELKDGESLAGMPMGGDGAELSLADASGKITKISRARIASMKPSSLSLMPEGLLQGLTEQQVKDLLTFLLIPPMAPAPLEIPGEPPPRKRAEIEPFLPGGKVAGDQKWKPLRIVLCAGPKDHGPSEHDYPFWQKRWAKLLAIADNVTVETAERWPSKEQFAAADVMVFYSNNPDWSAAKAPELDAFLNRGGGAVYLHYAVDGHDNVDELAQRIGLAWRGGACKFRHGPLDLKLQPHEITAGLTQVHFVDESYWQLLGNEKNYQLLASGEEEGAARPLMWVREQGRGRVFVSIPGHFTWTFDDPLFRLLILRGMAWSAHEPADRFVELITIGARVEP